MTSFSYICIMWLTFCVGLLSAEAEISVSGQVGSTAVLPCELQPVGTETPLIKWHIKSETVFEREGEESYQAEGYEGRVDVPEEELRKGNCSMVLRSLTLNDAGVYTSYQIVRRSKRSASVKTKAEEISRVNLSVYEKSEERQDPSTPSTLSGKAGINCPHLLILIISLFMCFLFSR